MLAAENIEVSFGGVRAVAGVSVSVDSGAATAVVGPNGSGKTTLLNAICGLIPASGSVSIDGTPLRTGRPSVIARSGVARTFQTPQVLDEMSCLDNVLLASADRRSSGLISAWFTRPRMLAAERDRWAEASAALSRFGLADFATAPASRLTYGQRRWLELARVVVARPSYLLADEPSAGLNHAETEQLSEHLRSLRSDGIGVLLVDHKVQFLRDVTERAIVLALGQKVAEDDIEAVWDLAEVQDAYLGNRRVRA